MKVELEKASTAEDEQAIIRAVSITEDIQSAIDILSNECRVIPVIKSRWDAGNGDMPADKENIMCRTDRILPVLRSPGVCIWLQAIYDTAAKCFPLQPAL